MSLKKYLGIDQSKRSTGFVMVNENGELLDWELINPTTDNEENISGQIQALEYFLVRCGGAPDGGLIEGLSFGAVGGAKDFLAGLQWAMRVHALRSTPSWFLGTVPVSMWRSKVLSKAEVAEAKKLGKDGVKIATVNKLPWEVKEAFETYVVDKKAKAVALYDLTDAYFIAQHCAKVLTDA